MTTQKIIDDLMVAACEAAGVTIEQFKSHSRKGEVMVARYIFLHILDRDYGSIFTREAQAQILNRDAATMTHGIAKTYDFYKYDKAFRDLVNAVSKKMGVGPIMLNETEKKSAVNVLDKQIDNLLFWLQSHPDNPYRVKIMQDVRDLQQDRANLLGHTNYDLQIRK